MSHKLSHVVISFGNNHCIGFANLLPHRQILPSESKHENKLMMKIYIIVKVFGSARSRLPERRQSYILSVSLKIVG